ncbi:MAG: hypothetical protein CMP26_11130 [Roseibacillus sp.]|nr:hypothetical protein [Roseibacillus sp.]
MFSGQSALMPVLNCFRAGVLATLLLSMGSILPLSARESYFVVEANSGRILLAEGSDQKRPVASLTKVATAIIALDWAKATGADLGGEMVVPPSVASLGGSNPMGLKPGDRISLRNALYSALMGSDNSAAQSIAHHVGFALQQARGNRGDPVKAFVAEMNILAGELEMRRTRFSTPHGLYVQRSKGYSTAADMARLCIYAMRNPGFAFFVKQKSRALSFKHGEVTKAFRVQNTNKILGRIQINGIKTGMTRAAGQCLATSSELRPIVEKLPDGATRLTPRRLVCIVLGSPDRFGQTEALVERGWNLYNQWVQSGAVVNSVSERLVVPDPRKQG